MSKNILPEICRMLGVELGEEFKIKGREYIFHFVDNGLMAYRANGRVLPYENCLAHFMRLINGEEEIVKLPWKPKAGETYWTFILYDSDIRLGIEPHKWLDDIFDFALFKAGWIYRSYEEAEVALPAVAKKMHVEFII